jgi:hypothetical protein
VSRQHERESGVRHLHSERDEGVVAAAAARLLAEAEHASDEVCGAAEPARTRIESECAAEDLRIAVAAELRNDRARMAEISTDLARVHGQLDQINAGIIRLQTRGLRQTGLAALALAVLAAIAWKVIAG